MQIDTTDHLTTEQAAVVLNLSVDTVRRYCNDKDPKIIGTKIGRDWLIPKREIARFRKGQRPKGRPPKDA